MEIRITTNAIYRIAEMPQPERQQLLKTVSVQSVIEKAQELEDTDDNICGLLADAVFESTKTKFGEAFEIIN